MRAAIYARVSSEEQVDGYSLDAQIRACRKHAKEQNWTVAAENVDEGASAHTDNIGTEWNTTWLSVSSNLDETLDSAMQVHLRRRLDEISNLLFDEVTQNLAQELKADYQEIWGAEV